MTDFYQILQVVSLKLQMCFRRVSTFELDPKWRHSRHLGFTKIFDISGTTWPISAKFCKSSHWSYTSMCFRWVLTFELDSKWRLGHHLGFTKIFDISGTIRRNSTKFFAGRRTEAVDMLLVSFNLRARSKMAGCAAILDLLKSLISSERLDRFLPNFAGRRVKAIVYIISVKRCDQMYIRSHKVRNLQWLR